MARRVQEENMRIGRGLEKEDPVKKYTAVNTLKEVELDPHFGGVVSLQYNFDGSQLVAGFSHGAVRVYNPKSGEMTKELRQSRHGGYPIMCLRFHPTEPHLLYAATAEGHVYLFNMESGACTHIITEKKNEINTMDFSLDGFNFCTCGKDLAVRVYTTSNNVLEKEFEGGGLNSRPPKDEKLEPGNTMRVFALKFHPDNEHIFTTAGWDNHIKIWDVRTKEGIRRQIQGPHVCGDSLDMKGRTILSGSWKGLHALQEWDYHEGKLVREIKFPHGEQGAFLYCAQYGGNDCVLAGGSGTNSVEVIEASTNKHLGGVQMNKPVQAMDSAMGGRVFAVGGQDNTLKLCSLTGPQASKK